MRSPLNQSELETLTYGRESLRMMTEMIEPLIEMQQRYDGYKEGPSLEGVVQDTILNMRAVVPIEAVRRDVISDKPRNQLATMVATLNNEVRKMFAGGNVTAQEQVNVEMQTPTMKDPLPLFLVKYFVTLQNISNQINALSNRTSFANARANDSFIARHADSEDDLQLLSELNKGRFENAGTLLQALHGDFWKSNAMDLSGKTGTVELTGEDRERYLPN